MHLNTALQNTELYVSYILMFLIKKLYMPYGTSIEHATKQTQTNVFKRKTRFGVSALPAGPSGPPLYNERTGTASRLRTSDYTRPQQPCHVPYLLMGHVRARAVAKQGCKLSAPVPPPACRAHGAQAPHCPVTTDSGAGGGHGPDSPFAGWTAPVGTHQRVQR